MNIHAHTEDVKDPSKCGPCGYDLSTKPILGKLNDVIHVHDYNIIVYLTPQEKEQYGIPQTSNLYFREVCKCGAIKGGKDAYTSAISNYNDGEGYVNEAVRKLIKKKAEETGLSYEYLLGTFLREGTYEDGSIYFGNTYVASCVKMWNNGNTTPLNNFFLGLFGEDMSFTAVVNGKETIITPEKLAANPELLSNINVSLEITVANMQNILDDIEYIQDEDERYKTLTDLYGGTTIQDNWSEENKKIANDWRDAYYEYVKIIGTLEANGVYYPEPGVGAFYCFLTGREYGEFDSFLIDNNR